MKRLSFLVFLIIALSCQNEQESEVQPQRTTSIDEFIRIPTKNGEVDKENMAAIKFDHTYFSFDTIQEGQTVEHVYPFKNTGKKDLLIADVTTSCGCTVPYYPDKPISPGNGDEIKVVFDSEDKVGHQDKKISIFANTYPNETQITISGYVKEKKK
jgi:hypothetical protein